MTFKIEGILAEYLAEDLDSLLDSDDEESPFFKCESPIEQLMYIALKKLFRNFEDFRDEYIFNIDSQKKIGKSKFRTDISLSFGDAEKRVMHLYAIECDGHEFHEKTKEQVRRDRERERYLMKKGYKVIRFSGSEIVEDPNECAREVWTIIKNDFKMLNGLSR